MMHGLSNSGSFADRKWLLKVICNDFLPNWLKVVSICLLQYKPVCVTNFDKLCREMLKITSLLVFFGIVILRLFPSCVTSCQDMLVLFALLCVIEIR